jgi:simple sugar transport system ATP-binding protein
MSSTLLKMQGITKSFFENKVLRNVNLTLERGEILGLVGENGAGKSTLMNILFGLPIIFETGGFEGKIYLEDQEVRFTSPLQALDAGIGMVHQEFSLIPGFTAAENIVLNRESTMYNFLVEIFGERLATLDYPKIKSRATNAIGRLGLSLDSDMIVSEMPVGHKQFTEIAREIEKENTKLLVLDEPTAVLTESEAKILLDAMRRLASQGIGIIFISHRLQEVLEACDRIVVLRDGEITLEKKANETNLREIASAMVGRRIEGLTQRTGEDRAFTKPILTVEHLWVDMPGETVRDVNLEVYEGEILGIGGLAGQGKLGIANGIMGLFPAGGKVIFQGDELPLNNPAVPLKKGIGFVSEDRRGVGLILDEGIAFNIVFTAMQIHDVYLKTYLGGLVKWRNDQEIVKAAKQYIEMLAIRCVNENQKVKELSGGNQQKVCLARAFALDPKLLFVSEPTRGIDIGAKKLVLDMIYQRNRQHGTTIVVTSSELEEMRAICDRIAIVHEGKIAGILPASSDSSEFGLLLMGAKASNEEGVISVG